MATSGPLTGSELIDCSKANSNQGVTLAAERCGYGEDIAQYEQALKQAGEEMGMSIDSFAALSGTSAAEDTEAGVVIAPYTQNQI
jgi:hypothetical protein